MSSQTRAPLRASAFVSPHALVQGEVYTVVKHNITPDAKHFPPVPTTLMRPNSVRLPDFTLNWIPNEHPFMFLVLVYPPFYGPLFDRLAVSYKSVPVTRIRKDCYELGPQLKTEWVSLERNLRAIVSAMIDICAAPLPTFFAFWAFPKRYGYERPYPSQEVVRIVAIRSRDTFIPLMAAITFMLLILNDREALVPGFSWRDRVLKKTKIHHHWLSMLEDSVVGDFQLARVGGIIDMQKCQYQALIPLIAKARLDMYLCWGDIDATPFRPLPYLSKKDLVPKHDQIANLRHISRFPPPPSPVRDAEITSHLHSDNDDAPRFPPVERYSRQRPGETWQEFFARRQENCLQKLEHETPLQYQSRLAKETWAAKHNAPGRKGSNVFQWDKVDGFRIRRAVGYKRYNLFWEDYSNAQRKYNGFYDEWDICTEFGDPDSGDDDSDLKDFWNGNNVEDSGGKGKGVDEGIGAMNHVPLDLFDDDQQIPDHQEEIYSLSTDLGRVHADYEERTGLGYSTDKFDVSPSPITESFEDAMYHQFGFYPISTVAPPSQPYQITWDLASLILGSGRWRDFSTSSPFPNQTIQNNICIFLQYMWKTPQVVSILVEILDVHQATSDIRHPQRTLQVRQQNFGQTSYYLIRPWENLRWDTALMELGLTSALTVLDLLRRQVGPSLVTVAQFLLDRGVSFKTFIRDKPHSQAESIRLRFQGLGYRPKNYVPDAVDYRAYVSSCDRFLRTSRCRAALLAGGLIARIARDAVPYSEVLYGPSEAVFKEGLCLWDGKDSSQGYWDDKLTEDEVDRICGVYKVATGQREQGIPQTTDLSWWPKPSMWLASGLNVGYWSEDCERWYQNRLQKCIAGTAPLRDPGHWRHALRFSKEVPQMVNKGESLVVSCLTHLQIVE